MSKKRKSYSADFKQDAVSRMAHAKTITGLAEKLGVRRKFLYLWRDQLQAGGRAALERRRGRPPGSKSETVSSPAPNAAESRIAELERLLGRKQLEVDFLDEPSNKSGEQRRIVPAMAARSLSLDRSLALVRRSRSDRGTAMPGSGSEPSGFLSVFAADCARTGRHVAACSVAGISS
jgi:transposase